MARLGSKFRCPLFPAETSPANAERSVDNLILPHGDRNSPNCLQTVLQIEGSVYQFCLASPRSASPLLCKSEISAPSWALLIPTGTKQDTDSVTSFCLVLTLLPSNVRSSSVPCFPKWRQWGWTEAKMPANRGLLGSFQVVAAGWGWSPWTPSLPGVEGNTAFSIT